MSRVLTVRVRDSSGKDLLQVTNLVDVPLESTFRDVLNDLPGDFADRTLLEVFVREYEGAPDLSSLKLHAGLLDKSLTEIDLILQQHRKPWPGPAAPVVQNAFTLLAASGACTANNLCLSSISCMRAAEQLCRIILAATATAMRATAQTPPAAMAVTAWGAAVQLRRETSRREVQWLTVMLMAQKQLVLLAMQQNLRSRKHKALARIARTQHGDVRSVQQPRQLPLVWCRTQ
jgi:hypothetical protein